MKLKVWWKPQIPCESFEVLVRSVDEAKLLITVLADYDIWQFEHHIKPDYCNAGGLVTLENGEWVDWESVDGESIDEWRGWQVR